MFPLFNREIFEARFERQYSDQPPTEVAWYACFNMVLALGSAVLATSNLPADSKSSCRMIESETYSSKYLANATSVFVDLQFGLPDLMSVQAILTMVSIASPDDRPDY